MDRYFNPEIETASREYLWALQSARLIKMVHNAYDHVPFYQKKFDEIGLLPGDIKTIDDITKLPFTVKQDLRDNYPLRLVCCAQRSAGAYPCILGHNGQTDGCRLYAE